MKAQCEHSKTDCKTENTHNCVCVQDALKTQQAALGTFKQFLQTRLHDPRRLRR